MIPVNALAQHAKSLIEAIPGQPPRLPIITIGPKDIILEAKSTQDLKVLADAKQLSYGEQPTQPTNLHILADNLLGYRQDPLQKLFREAYQKDRTPVEILQALARGDRQHTQLTLSECENNHGILLYRGRIFVPNHDALRLHFIESHHSTPAFGHPGRAKTLELVQCEYFQQTMQKDIERFVRNCQLCQHSRNIRHNSSGLLQPLSTPQAPWRDSSMDLVVGLPWSDRNDAI